VIPGAVWPFVCIVIMCGAISGFHSLIASGTTPKMINRESEIRPIGYGAMVVEGFVAVTALVAACALEPGDYFAINVAQKTAAQKTAYEQFVSLAPEHHGWELAPRELTTLESETGEKLVGRTGGAVTLAVGMAKVFASLPGLQTLMSYWYHFVIMFEALFILTLLETGTRVARFVVQETAAQFNPRLSLGGRPRWGWNIVMSIVTCGAWGGLLYLGDLSVLWSMLGIANQLLATIALAVGTTFLLRTTARRAYALCTGVPFAFVLITTCVASVGKIQEWWGKIPAAEPDQALLLRLVCVLASIMLGLTVLIAVDAIRRWTALLQQPAATVAAGASAGR
jgi:carbon starvation protein